MPKSVPLHSPTSLSSADISEDTEGWPQRIAVIGAAGTVGSAVAAQIALAGIGRELFLIDIQENLAKSHAIDIADAQAIDQVSAPALLPGPPHDGPVDLVVVAASKPEMPAGDRWDFLHANAKLLKSLVPQIEELAGNNGVVLVLSNPVDILASWLLRHSSLTTDRILGYSLNDSARFCSAVARILGVCINRVEGKVLGEHGKGQVPLFSSLRLDGEPFFLSEQQKSEISEDVNGWFLRWSALEPGRSSGWATGVGVRHLLQALAAGRAVVTTASTAGLKGYPNVFIALEICRTKTGIQVLTPTTTPEEAHELLAAAQRVRDAVKNLSGGSR